MHAENLLSRRAFCAALTASVSHAREAIGIGFLGVSHSHADAKLRLIRESPEWRLIGVCESDPKLIADCIAKLHLPAADERKVFCENARRLFHL